MITDIVVDVIVAVLVLVILSLLLIFDVMPFSSGRFVIPCSIFIIVQVVKCH